MSHLICILFVFFVQFLDKQGSQHLALSEVAIEKRMNRGIAIDSMDYAVSPIYMDSLRNEGCYIYHTSRWLNGATIDTDSATILKIAKWDFVRTITLTRTQEKLNVKKEKWQAASEQHERTRQIDNNAQIEQLNLHMLHKENYHGQGIVIAIIDGGFLGIDTLGAFDATRKQILGFYDTTDDLDSITGYTGDHGIKCFSTIAACTDNYIGTATKAQYYLIRSEEIFTESPKEMDNWVAAVELADSLGSDIISSSLGYARFDDERFTLTYSDMNGQTTRCAQAANIAARKGMLVVVAAGNEGDKAWHYITSPADAEDIIAVGATDVNGNIAAFSSYGPSVDGRVKPEVCATGKQTSIINPLNNTVVNGNGTSFACPLIAGMAACLWSALPDATNMEIRERIIRSADRYTQPHEQYGYGIPDAWMAYQLATHTTTLTTPTQATKIIQDGQLYILYNNEYYTILGNKISKQ